MCAKSKGPGSLVQRGSLGMSEAVRTTLRIDSGHGTSYGPLSELRALGSHAPSWAYPYQRVQREGTAVDAAAVCGWPCGQLGGVAPRRPSGQHKASPKQIGAILSRSVS